MFGPRLHILDLKKAMRKNGHVEWPKKAQQKKNPSVCSHELAELLRTTAGSNRGACNRLVLKNLCLIGPLDLTGAGMLGVPIVPFELQNCSIMGGIDTSHAYMQGLVIEDCRLYKITEDDIIDECEKKAKPATIVGKNNNSQLRFTGATIYEKIEITRLSAPEDTVIDFSHSVVLHDCKLSDVRSRAEGNPHPDDTSGREAEEDSGIACITFANATVAGGLTFEGVHVRALRKDGQAVNCAELRLAGSLVFRCSERFQCRLKGELRLTGAEIRGDIRMIGVSLIAQQRQGSSDPPVTIAASGLKLAGNLRFSQENGHPENPCVVCGQIDLSEARIGGDMVAAGVYQAVDHTRIINAKSAHIDGDVRFGWLLGDSRSKCTVEGEVDFSNAQIGGKFVASGSEHRLKRPSANPGSNTCASPQIHAKNSARRWAQFAIKLVGATVKNNVVLQGSTCRVCLVEGVALTGATIQGQLVIEGVTLRAADAAEVPFRMDKTRKAISANGVTVRGGVYISEEAPQPGHEETNPRQRTNILGDVRFRNAKINGPMIVRGVKMESSDSKVAFWAAGATFGSDLIFEPTPLHEMEISGEVRLWGATIQSNLRFEGARIVAQTTGSAVDAALANVTRAVYIGVSTKETKKAGVVSDIKGLVNLNFLNCALLTIGEDPPQHSVANSTKSALKLTGAIFLRESRIRGPVTLSGLALRPSEELEEPTAALSRMKELSISQANVLIHATYAELGTRLFVRLLKSSSGFINLYGSRTGTIGALHPGNPERRDEQELQCCDEREIVDEDWGEKPKQIGNWRAGNPAAANPGEPNITVNLDHFRYSRLFDKVETVKDTEVITTRTRRCWRFYGRPLPGDLSPRHGWLRHQTLNPGMPDEIVTWPYRQLAKVYRDMGDLKRAYAYEMERRWLEIKHTDAGGAQRWFNRLFGFFFGFGYSSERAAIWLAVWMAIMTGFLLLFALKHTSGSPNECSLKVQQTWLYATWSAAAEAFRLLIPNSLKFNTGSVCVYNNTGNGSPFFNKAFYFWFGLLQFIGRVLVIGATLTFTGILQEKAPVANSVRD
jgi:hypothetical protein